MSLLSTIRQWFGLALALAMAGGPAAPLWAEEAPAGGSLVGEGLSGMPADFDAYGRRIKAVAEAFTESAGNRQPGQPGNELMSERIGRLFGASGVPHGQTRFEMPVFIPGAASLEAAGRRIRIHALLPNIVELSNFDQARFDTRVVYAGRGELIDLDGKEIAGALVLLDFDSGTNYLDAMKNGALGCLFIEPDDYAPNQAYAKVLNLPFTIPRYQVPRSDARFLIEQGAGAPEGVTVRVEAEPNRWERRELANHWALIEGADPDLKDDMVILVAHYDTLHYCPELATGGEDGLNLSLLMNLFEHYRRHRPARTLLFMAHNAKHWYHAGASEMVARLLGSEADIFDIQDGRPSVERVLKRALAENAYYAGHYERLVDEPITQEVITHFRDTRAMVSGMRVALMEPVVRRMEIDMHHMRERRLALLRRGELTSDLEAQIDAELAWLGQLVTMFNRLGRVEKWDNLDADQQERFLAYCRRVAEHRRSAAKRVQRQLAELETIREVRELLQPYRPMLALALSAGYNNEWLGMLSRFIAPGDDFGDSHHAHHRIRRRLGDLFANRLYLAIQEPRFAGLGVQWNPGSSARLYNDLASLPSNQFMIGSIAAFDILSPYDPRDRLMGSADRIDTLPDGIVGRKTTFQFRLIDLILTDPAVTGALLQRGPGGTMESRMGYSRAGSAEVITHVQDGSSIRGVETVMPNAIVTVPANRKSEYVTALKGGMLSNRLLMTDSMGRAIAYNLPQGVGIPCQAFQIDEEGHIAFATDFGVAGQKYTTDLVARQIFKDFHRIVMVAGTKADLYDLFDPKNHRPLESPILQRAGGGKVERYSQSGFAGTKRRARGDGYASIFYNPDLRVKLLLSHDVSLINASPESPYGRGYTVDQLDRQPVPRLAASDAIAISRERIELLRKNAVRDELVIDLQRQAEVWYLGAATGPGGEPAVAPEGRREPPLSELAGTPRILDTFRRTIKSYGVAFGVYPAVNATMADMMKAVMFYLAVLIPFCFFLQRLLFVFKKIQAQIAAFVGLFVATYLVFHSIHPAFSVADTPQIILIAFVMLVLALFVATAMRGKFDYHMENFKERFLSEEEAGVLKLAGTAMLVGVTNMKRRKLRTAMTCLTIILVTFTMLSFTSISQRVSPTRIRQPGEAPYDGVFFARQAWLDLGDNAARGLTHVLGEQFDGQPAQTLRRGFVAHTPQTETYLMPEGTYDDYSIRGILAVEMAEDGWLGPMPVTAGRFFSSENAQEILVTDTFATALLGLDLDAPFPDDVWVRLAGVRLRVVGALDSEAMRSMRDLRGTSIIPQELAMGAATPDRLAHLVMEDGEVPEGTFRDVDSQFYVVVPYGLRHRLDVPTVSVSVKMPNAQAVWDRLEEFVYYSDNRVYFGVTEPFIIMPGDDPVYEQPGRYYLGSGFATSIGGLSSLIIPLLVAATIIFNTMLGAVYERRREIGIFNAIGLNPIHIALFFVAEALVYGIIGGVSGYLIGQVLAKGITAFGLMEDINLNYSSLSVVYVILLAIVIVLLSSIYPALVAMRTAVASSGRRAIEQDSENHLTVRFPFSFTRAMAVAANNYLKDYFDRHNDSSIGDFVATETGAALEQSNGRELMLRLEFEVALAPFDLGVTQRIKLKTHFNEEVGAYMVAAEVERLSGQENNWIATNKPFLNGIRKYLMHWRLLPPEGRDAHLEEGRQRFGLDAAALE